MSEEGIIERHKRWAKDTGYVGCQNGPPADLLVLAEEMADALREACEIFRSLEENEPDCLGWHPPFPSTESEISRVVRRYDALIAKIDGEADVP